MSALEATTKPDARPEEVGLSGARLARISAWMRRWVDAGRLPGVLVAVLRRGRLAFFETQGLRDVEAGLPLAADTLFRIYSMTKPITSTAALMLYEEGCFQLDDPIARFIPFPDSLQPIDRSLDELARLGIQFIEPVVQDDTVDVCLAHGEQLPLIRCRSGLDVGKETPFSSEGAVA